MAHHAAAMDRRLGVGLAFGAAVISGVSVWINAMAVRAFGDAVLYTTAKNLIAAALLIAVTLAWTSRGSRAGFTRPHGRRQLIGLGVVGLFGGGVAFVLFFEGLLRTTPASAAFIQKTLVIWVAILAVTFLRERFGPVHVGAIALLMAGQIVAAGGLALPALNSGEAMILAATLVWAAEVVVAKWLLAGLSPLTVASARMGIGAVALVAFSAVSGHAALLASLSGTQWAWVALTGLVLTAYVATWLSALARAQATDVTAMLVFGAIITALLTGGPQAVTIAPAALGLWLIVAGVLALAVVSARGPHAVRRPAA